MTMVEISNCWDTLVDGITGEEEFENILNNLDFPMENIEEAETGLVADWDPQFLGPIPSNVLMEPPKVKIDTGPPYLLSGPVSPQSSKINGAPAQEQLPDHIEASGPHILKPNKLAEIQESRMFRSQSPISVLETIASSSSTAKIPPAHFNSPIPVRARSKRIRRAAINPWLRQFPTSSSASKQTSNPGIDRERRKKTSHPPFSAKQITKNVEKKLQIPNYSDLKRPSSHRPAFIKKCTHCEATKTPQWREGPLGPKTLCNACGVRYRSGRLFPEYRPAASPTFVPSLHSNSHHKVIEMRNKGKRPMITYIEEPPMSPEAEFVPMSNHFFDLY